MSSLVTDILEKHPPAQKIKLTTNISPPLPFIFVDPPQIKQILTNLIINAYQAMPEGGELNISAKDEKDKIHLSLTDTGCGISKENIKKLFEPLFTTKARGIGMGLPIAKNLMDINEGKIKVKSEEEKGTTFTLIFPIKKVQ